MGADGAVRLLRDSYAVARLSPSRAFYATGTAGRSAFSAPSLLRHEYGGVLGLLRASYATGTAGRSAAVVSGSAGCGVRSANKLSGTPTSTMAAAMTSVDW